MSSTDDRQDLLASFGKVLNSHGHAFQYAVLKAAQDLFQSGESLWVFEASEFPVAVQGSSTRIDFVLKKRLDSMEKQVPFYMVAECKRANPAIAAWCFAKAPYVRRNRASEPCILEHVEIDDTGYLNGCGIAHHPVDNPFHLALEVRTNDKGDKAGAGRGAIEEAATQVCRGLNGLVETIVKLFQYPGVPHQADFIPAIFTTAALWVTDADLTATQLSTGEIDLSGFGFRRVPWLIYQYHMSPGIKNYVQLKYHVDGPAEYMDFEYVRSIAVVDSQSVAQFLRWASIFDRD